MLFIQYVCLNYFNKILFTSHPSEKAGLKKIFRHFLFFSNMLTDLESEYMKNLIKATTKIISV